MTTKTVQQQIDFIELKIKEVLESPNALSSNDTLTENKVDVSQNPNNIIMTTKTIQQQIDFIEFKIKEELDLIYILKRNYCIHKLPIALSGDDDLKKLTENKVDVSQNPNNIIMKTKTIQQQIDFIEFKIKEDLDLIDILKRSYCIHELPIALSGDDDLKKLIDKNVKVSQNHENALIDIENFKLNDLHHHKLKNISKLA